MTMVRFATLCDHCNRRSEEYTAWPSCRECYVHICPACQEPGTLRETDGECSETALCRTCADAEYRERLDHAG